MDGHREVLRVGRTVVALEQLLGRAAHPERSVEEDGRALVRIVAAVLSHRFLRSELVDDALASEVDVPQA